VTKQLSKDVEGKVPCRQCGIRWCKPSRTEASPIHLHSLRTCASGAASVYEQLQGPRDEATQ